MSNRLTSDWQLLPKSKPKDIKEEFYIKQCVRDEYFKLMEFHYIVTALGSGSYRFFGLYHKKTNILYGVVCCGTPNISLKARNETVLGRILNEYHSRERLPLVNKLIVAVRRLVLHPSVRGGGIAEWFLNEVHKRLNKPFIEHVSIMSYYNNAFLPKDYAYFIKVSNLHSLRYVYTKVNAKGTGIRDRVISPKQNYGYALYVKKELLTPDLLKYLK